MEELCLCSLAVQLILGGCFLLILWNLKLVLAVLSVLPRDIKGLTRLIKTQLALTYSQRNDSSVSDIFDKIVEKDPNKIVMHFEEQKWTTGQVQSLSNQIANYFQDLGYRKGDSIALFMQNQPEYVCIWLGLSKIGVNTALINYNLRMQPLRHCMEVVKCKAVIFDPQLYTAIQELTQSGDLKMKLYSWGSKPSEDCTDLEAKLKSVGKDTPKRLDKIRFLDPLLYIYTSGTTGFPKAATIKHARLLMVAMGNFYFHGMTTDDVLYTSLPLYHGSGAMLGSGQMLCFGVAMVVRKKFSASQFWDDCIRYNVTVAQYIGEICRYLISQPASDKDKQHKVRMMFGNGLRAEIWENFVQRFNIPQINELYGSTEGNCNMANLDNKVGAIGFVPRYAQSLLHMNLIKVDEVTGEPIRDPKTGFVIKCNVNEPGELIGRIERNHPIRDFEGYADQSSSKSKILSNVFKNGDAYFRSGDILEMDIYGYFYFKDRKGDTFRWKGENCSTAEVESVISTVCGLKDVVVYGVEIPGCEGRAGMASIVDPDDIIELNSLSDGFAKSLPSYARPMFIRKLARIDVTGTFKLKKYDLQKDGFDISKTTDKIYFYSGSKYVLLDRPLYADLISGRIRL